MNMPNHSHRIALFAFLAIFMLAFSACNPAGLPGTEKSASPDIDSAGPKPIYNGHTSPDLLTDMPVNQQNAVVSLYLYLGGGEMAGCTATLISPHIILTAAHCVNHNGSQISASNVEVNIGPNSASPINTLYAQSVHTNQFYGGSERYDMAIIVLNNPYYGVTPIPIRNGGTSGLYGEYSQSVGYGKTNYDPYEWNSIRYWTSMPICANGSGAITACGYQSTGIGQGDSGGPLLYEFTEGIRVIGVASTGTDLSEWEEYIGNYSPVPTNEMWIQGFVDQYDNPECVSTCQTIECGEYNGCACGVCPRGSECVEHVCETMPHGTGGACVTANPTTQVCTSDGECQGEEVCVQYEGNVSECGMPCGPEKCSPDDIYSYCLPVGGGTNLCVEDNPQSCSNQDSPCTTSDGRTGYCLQLFVGGPVACYTLCETVETCPENTGCVPYGGSSDDCEELCEGAECGNVGACDCGDCPSGEVCFRYQCRDDCNCDDKECGPDGCNGYCGSCGFGETCNEDGHCVEVSGCQGACNPDSVSSFCVDGETICKCSGEWKEFGCWLVCPGAESFFCGPDSVTGQAACNCGGGSTDECEGVCSPLDEPFCITGTQSLCRCVGMQLTVIDCDDYCSERGQELVGCAPSGGGADACICTSADGDGSEDQPPDGDGSEDPIPDGDGSINPNPDGDGSVPAPPSGGSGADGVSDSGCLAMTATPGNWTFLLLTLLGFAVTRRSSRRF